MAPGGMLIEAKLLRKEMRRKRERTILSDLKKLREGRERGVRAMLLGKKVRR